MPRQITVVTSPSWSLMTERWYEKAIGDGERLLALNGVHDLP